MKTLNFKIELGTFDFSVSAEEVLKGYLTEPGTFIEFLKRGIFELKKSDNDIVHIELNELGNIFAIPAIDAVLTQVLDFSKNPDHSKSDVNELISKLIAG